MARRPWRKTPKLLKRRQRGLGRIADWLSARPRAIHLLFFLMLLAVGAAATTTVKVQSSDPLASLSEDQLVTLLGELQLREDELREERRELQDQLTNLSQAVDAKEAAAEASQKARWSAEVAAGVVPVSGPGVLLRVDEPSQPFPVSVFVTTLAELRNAGAEAIEVNNVRVTGRTWFGLSDTGGFVVDGQQINAPYVWRAIGDPDTLAMGLEIRGGAASQQRGYGSLVDVQKLPNVEIASTVTALEPEFATLKPDND